MSIVYGGIVVAIALVFVVQFRPGSGQETASLTQQCAANIRDRCIDPKEFQASLGLIAPRGAADDQRLRAMGIRRIVLDGLVERTLLVQDAQRLGVTVSDEEINSELVKGRFHVSLPVERMQLGLFYLGLTPDMVRPMAVTGEGGKFDYKIYKQVVRVNTNRGEAEFKEMQREEIIAERMRDIIRARARISDEEAFDRYVREKSKAKIETVALRRPFFVENFIDTSPRAVSEWAVEHSEEVDKSWEAAKPQYPPGCREARHVLILLQTENQPKGHERGEAQKLIESARERLQAGEGFASVAQDLSEDEVSAARGGALGCSLKGKWVKPFEDALFALKKPGDLTEVVESAYGFHIIKLERIVPEDPQQAERQGKLAVAENMMVAMKTEQLIGDTAKQLRELVAGGKPMQEALDQVLAGLMAKRPEGKAVKKGEAAAELPGQPKVETSESFTMEGSPIEGTAPGENVATKVFKIAKPGDVASDLVRLQDGYAVVRLLEREDATREQFDKERHEYVDALRAKKQDDLLSNYIDRLRNKASGDVRINEAYAQEPKSRDDE